MGASVKAFARGYSPLHLAAKYGDGAMVQVLLKAGADIEGRQKNALGGGTPLAEALSARNLAAAEALIKGGASLTARNNYKRTLLYEAASENLAKLIPLIAKKVDVNAIDASGGTALHVASYFGHLEAMDALLALKAKRDVLSNGREGDHGGAPIHEAAAGGQPKAIARLLKAGDDVDMPSRKGETPLYFAIREKSLPTVNALLKAGAKVNVHDKKRVTPLMAAVMKGEVEVAKLLISKGGDLQVRTKERAMITDSKDAMHTVPPGSSLHDIAKLMKMPKLAALVRA
jgi:ankyrin repeat protein